MKKFMKNTGKEVELMCELEEREVRNLAKFLIEMICFTSEDTIQPLIDIMKGFKIFTIDSIDDVVDKCSDVGYCFLYCEKEIVSDRFVLTEEYEGYDPIHVADTIVRMVIKSNSPYNDEELDYYVSNFFNASNISPYDDTYCYDDLTDGQLSDYLNRHNFG